MFKSVRFHEANTTLHQHTELVVLNREISHYKSMITMECNIK